MSLVTNNKVSEVSRAILFGSKPPRNDSLWQAMKNARFEISILDRNINNKEKAVDTGIVNQIAKCLYRETKPDDIFVLVMGDKDFVPSVKSIQEEGLIARVAFWNNVSAELVGESYQFLDLTPRLDEITAINPTIF